MIECCCHVKCIVPPHLHSLTGSLCSLQLKCETNLLNPWVEDVHLNSAILITTYGSDGLRITATDMLVTVDRLHGAPS
jgi:hypothetical protein